MDYLGPSRAKARAGANAWSELTTAEEKRIHNDKPECKKIVECLKRAGPTLEVAAHRILTNDWWNDWIQKIKLFLLLAIGLLLLGGYGLVYRVATANSYSEAANDVYSTLVEGQGGPSMNDIPAHNQPYPLLPTPHIPDPGPPGWA